MASLFVWFWKFWKSCITSICICVKYHLTCFLGLDLFLSPFVEVSSSDFINNDSWFSRLVTISCRSSTLNKGWQICFGKIKVWQFRVVLMLILQTNRKMYTFIYQYWVLRQYLFSLGFNKYALNWKGIHLPKLCR